MEIPVSAMDVVVRQRSSRLSYSLRGIGLWSGQIPFLSGSYSEQDNNRSQQTTGLWSGQIPFLSGSYSEQDSNGS